MNPSNTQLNGKISQFEIQEGDVFTTLPSCGGRRELHYFYRGGVCQPMYAVLNGTSQTVTAERGDNEHNATREEVNTYFQRRGVTISWPEDRMRCCGPKTDLQLQLAERELAATQKSLAIARAKNLDLADKLVKLQQRLSESQALTARTRSAILATGIGNEAMSTDDLVGLVVQYVPAFKTALDASKSVVARFTRVRELAQTIRDTYSCWSTASRRAFEIIEEATPEMVNVTITPKAKEAA